MASEEEEPKWVQYPLDSNSYKILDKICVHASAVVYKAICVPMDYAVVAIKAINLDQSRTDFDYVRREARTLSLLSHPNILNAYGSFTVDRSHWVVMPFMSAGSLQSIISSSFPDGLSEPCIAIVLKETLLALSYLHNQGLLHRDIKASNILVDSIGSVKLSDFGISASIYESDSIRGWSSSPSSSSLMLTDVAAAPYWMAPEVIHSHHGYSFKADIWSFGITALELVHGRPPLSHLPPSESLLQMITKRFRFSDYEKHKNNKHKNFSKAFKEMVALCLDQDPSKRPSAYQLLKHSFFENCEGSDFLVKNVLQGLPSVEERFKESKITHSDLSSSNTGDDDREDDEGNSVRQKTEERRISVWNFNEDGFELDPVFPSESKDNSVVKRVRFGGEIIIHDQGGESGELSGDVSPSSQVEGGLENQVISGHSESESSRIGGEGQSGGGGVERKGTFLDGLVALRLSLDDQRAKVSQMISMVSGEAVSGEVSREEQMAQLIQKLTAELENERKKSFELELELEMIKFRAEGYDDSGSTADEA
ncbi:Serine/threonine-protein kinase BLUS1 [Morella rubra]|uniref:Serine/threonine-protein kinase BLUS1 n=1 Tax=Morella rubra TaxID=262757 RepID=A0A6A1W1Q2_9ROSI|nr:Serine/threonine-protein kinase BLUS1 [Morella rubra]